MPAACACRDWTPLLHANICLLRWILFWELCNRFPFGLLVWWDLSAVSSSVVRQGIKNSPWLLMLAFKNICQSKAEMYLEDKAVIKAKILAVWRKPGVSLACPPAQAGMQPVAPQTCCHGNCAGLGVTSPTQHKLALLLCHPVLQQWGREDWWPQAQTRVFWLQNLGGELMGRASAQLYASQLCLSRGWGCGAAFAPRTAPVLSRGSRMMFLQEWVLCQPCRAAALGELAVPGGMDLSLLSSGCREEGALPLSWGFCLSSVGNVGKEGLSGAVLDYISAVSWLYCWKWARVSVSHLWNNSWRQRGKDFQNVTELIGYAPSSPQQQKKKYWEALHSAGSCSQRGWSSTEKIRRLEWMSCTADLCRGWILSPNVTGAVVSEITHYWFMAENSCQNKVLLTHRLYGLSAFYSLSLWALYLNGHHDQGQGSCCTWCCGKVVTQDLSAQRSVTVTLLLRPSLFSFPQRETLLRQLETNQLDIDATLEELSVQQETEDQNYELYVTELSFLLPNCCFGCHMNVGQPQLWHVARLKGLASNI